MRRIKQRLRNKLNIAPAEKPSDKWQACELSCVHVDYVRERVVGLFAKIEEMVRSNYDIQLLDVEKDIL